MKVLAGEITGLDVILDVVVVVEEEVVVAVVVVLDLVITGIPLASRRRVVLLARPTMVKKIYREYGQDINIYLLKKYIFNIK